MFTLYIHIAIAANISIIKIIGNPITNFTFFVLCLNIYIPAIPPIPAS